MPKRTYQPKKKRKKRTSGFRVRMKVRKGKKIIQNRRLKGRAKIAH